MGELNDHSIQIKQAKKACSNALVHLDSMIKDPQSSEELKIVCKICFQHIHKSAKHLHTGQTLISTLDAMKGGTPPVTDQCLLCQNRPPVGKQTNA